MSSTEHLNCFLECTKVHIEHYSPPPHTGPTFNINNLSHVLEGVQNMESVALQLNIPLSKWIEMEQRNPNKRDHRRVVVTYYIERVPGATWLGVADALWWRDEYTQLEVVNKLYLRGKTQ